jgi:hypothetical protein
VAIITNQVKIIMVIVTDDSQDVIFVSTSKTEKFTDDTWICDGGAYGHYCIFDKGFFDLKQIHESITFGSGNTMMATTVGTLNCQNIYGDGSGIDITLYKVKHVRNIPHVQAN